ncbi:DNA polymerase/3'-5' exonuclease PolX [Geotalea uraniireducens]|uniref:DNA polymerase beta n=1 Tax=Geotalea uraniireducens (strain Rf4) TaxID=351605 RepID=A5GEK4_GEOUR|nr:DNA polymerase/3'-5' exonuclease PolX [Geotalea uraniireducens]ABQ25859.1 PHP C-terminal domain protein [Geotalea uraniireducens Rf4]
MKNQEIARIFSEMADILEIKGDNPFKIRAYRRAALNIEGLSRSVEDLSRDELLEIPGIGEELAAKIEEYIGTGAIHAHDKLKGEIPSGLLSLLAVPGLGPKTARQIFEQRHIASIDDLERAAREHKLAGIPGIQKKTEENILKGIATVQQGHERRPLGRVLPLALDLVEELRKRARFGAIEIAGSIRRRKETCKDIDIVATSPAPEEAMKAFITLPAVEQIIMHGPTRSSVVISDGLQVDLRVVAEESFGAALAYLTGSKGHNVRLRDMAVKQGLKINEYGIFREKDEARLGGAKEEDVYRLLGLPFIPPEMREDQGEVEAALAGRLPQLISQADIRGDLHVHSRWSDGGHTIEELVAAAKARGLSYLAITDHSQGLGVAHGLTVERLMAQKQEIAALNIQLTGFTILHGTEMDIKSDGSLDFPDQALKELDLVIASIHSGFKQTKEQITTRIIKAMKNPYVSIIAHPTGRLIGERDPYEVEMDDILRVAADTGTAIEINAYPLRLDLNDSHARRAKELGVPLVINTDTHSISQFDTLPYGIAIARRAWLEKGDVLNTLAVKDLRKRLKGNKGLGIN